MRKAAWIIVGLVILVIIVLLSGASFFTDWLWFKSLDFSSVFWTSFTTGWIVRLLGFAVAFLFLWPNFGAAFHSFDRLPAQEDSPLGQFNLTRRALRWVNVAGCAVLALFLGAAFNPAWTAVQQFLHPVQAGVTDPILHLDIGYYLFQYPIWRSLNGLVQGIIWVALLGSVLIYYSAKAFWRQGNSFTLWAPAKTHLTILAALLFLAKIWGYTLARQGLLLTDTGLLTGVDYTAATVRMPVYSILSWIAVGCIVILIIGLFKRGFKLLVGGVGLLLVASFLLGSIYPGIIKSFVVKPNEFAKESPYLENHINATRQAFGLDKFTVMDYPLTTGNQQFTLSDPTLANLRLWDFRQLKLSYEQLQTLRPYYVFNDIDIDRYTIQGKQQQVMLSARELDTTQLPANAQNWVNLHLAYTHGYGLTLNAVNQVNSEGQPVFLVGNIPPRVSPGIDLEPLERPQIYFGETQNEYVVVPNGYGEFDHPTETSENATTNYSGTDGVPLNSIWTRALFALRFGETNFLLSKYITSDSKVLLYRGVRTRAQKLAPFLAYDSDPYLVMADGRLYWILDAYTTSGYYPYAARHAGTGVNYIRNSVKVVVDAYNGTTSFYVVDETDPVIQVWQKVFPNLFTSIDSMSAELRSHLRYPETLFRIQRDMLLTYHMTDLLTFFRKEDAWAVPTETTTGTEEEMVPYYVTMRLPGQQTGEFVMMQPLKPVADTRKNMIAWMAARCDGDHYGQVLVYLLPKDRIFYGPIQVEGRIAQNPEISQLLTLWGQQQSTVARGNLLVLPFDGDFLYVEPIYIVSSQGQQPELKMVVLVYKDQVVYGTTAADALAQLAGTGTQAAAQVQPGTGTTPSELAPVDRPVGLTADQMKKLLQTLEQSLKAQQDAINQQQDVLTKLKKSIGE